MPVLIFEHSDLLAEWAANRIPHVGAAGFGPCAAIGIASGATPQDELYAVAVFHDHQPVSATIQVSMAARSAKWATRGIIRALLHYVFQQLHVRKLWVAIPSDNARAIRFNEGIGMVRESVLRHHVGRNRHAVILSMMDDEYRHSRWYCSLQKEAA